MLIVFISYMPVQMYLTCHTYITVITNTIPLTYLL